MNPKKILIVSGEPSGDLHASNLVRDMKSLRQGLSFFGIGGELSKKEGVDTVFDITKLALVGVVEVVRHLSVVKQAHDAVMARAARDKPDLAILVDYPGFNLKLAGDLASRGIKVAYYISPQLWAWAPQRIHLIKRYVRKMVVFFRFEEDLYKSHGIDAEFVGHPLVDIVRVTLAKDEVFKRYGLSKDKRTIAILPGSRISEIRVFLPILAKAAAALSGSPGGVQFVVSKRPDRPASLYEEPLAGSHVDYRLVEGEIHNIVAACDFAIVASGTATLETAIIGTPYVLVYKANMLTFLLYKLVATIPFLGIANVIAGREIVPELKQFKMTPAKIASTVKALLGDPARLEAMRTDLAAVKASLGSPGASARAAKAFLQLL